MKSKDPLEQVRSQQEHTNNEGSYRGRRGEGVNKSELERFSSKNGYQYNSYGKGTCT